MIAGLRGRVRSIVEILSNGRLLPPDFDVPTRATVEAVRRFTMTSPERIAAVCEAVRYIVRSQIGGDFVECGVWQGGMVMAMLRTLLECGDTTREVFLYDTFAGMSAPSAEDQTYGGASAAEILAQKDRNDPSSAWCNASLEEVRRHVESVGYDAAKIHYVEGKVEDTLPGTIPARVALLRLDTDWYASTRHELEHLYPRLETGGVLILDDYGHWKGAREAVDRYIEEHRLRLLLNRTDYTGRIAVKL